MSAHSSDPHRPRGGRSDEPSQYRFHRQERVGRRPPPPSRDRGRADTPKSTEQVFDKNLRLFFSVTLGMTLFFFVSVTIYRKVWQAKHARVVSGISAAQAASGGVRSRTVRRAPAEGEWVPGTSVTLQPEEEALQQAVILARQGDTLRDAGRLEEACVQYSEALKVWPYLGKARAEMGRIHLRLKDYAKARIELEHAVGDDPGSAELLNDFGVALFRLSRFDRAMKLFETAAETKPDLAEAHFNAALCYTARGDRDRARASLEKHLQLKPNNPPALKQLAFLAAAAGNYTNAMEILGTVIAAAPDWPSAYFEAAATSALMGRAKDAIGYLEKARQIASPAAAYLVYQQPAFREIRNTGDGKAFEKALEEEARKQPGTVDVGAVLDSTPEPMMSPPTS